jgi:hypothetical protein
LLSPSHVHLTPLKLASLVDSVHISPSPLIFTMPFEFAGSADPIPVATIMSPLLVDCMNLPVQLEVPSCFTVLSMVANWVPLYLPVIVPSSLVSILSELFVISSMRLSVSLDLIVRLCRPVDFDFFDMSLEKLARDIISFAVFVLFHLIIQNSKSLSKKGYDSLAILLDACGIWKNCLKSWKTGIWSTARWRYNKSPNKSSPAKSSPKIIILRQHTITKHHLILK